jgi:hypothetical protein
MNPTATPETSAKRGIHLFLQLLPIIGMMWLGLFLRWDDIGAFPWFIDELHHMRRSQVVWEFSDPQTSFTPSKFGTYYWIGLFQLPDFPDPFLVRAPVAMLSIIGAAGAYALARILFNHTAGLLAVLMAVTWPLLLFFERLALTDPPTAVFVVLMAWWSLVFVRQPNMHRANVLGFLVTMMLIFKLIAGPTLLVPFMAAAFFGAYPLTFKQPLWPQIKRIWGFYWPYIRRVSVIVGSVWTVIFGIYIYRMIFTPGKVRSIVSEELYTGGLVGDRGGFDTNLTRMYEIFYYHWTVALIVVALLALGTLLWRRWRVGVFYVMSFLPLWIFLLVVATKLSTRYTTVVAYIHVALISGGLVMFMNTMRERGLAIVGYVPIIALLAWIVGYNMPFAVTTITAPTELALPARDRTEYFRHYTGWALEDTFGYIEERGVVDIGREDAVIVARIRVCDFHIYHLTDTQRENLNVVCQDYIGGESGSEHFARRYEWLNATLPEVGSGYLIVEQYDNPEAPVTIYPERLNVETTLLATFERPFDGIPVEIYEFHAHTSTARTATEPE